MRLVSYLIGAGIVALAIVIEGLVLSCLWDWFMMPLGLPAISVAHAVGIAALSGVLTSQYIPKAQEDDAGKRLLYCFGSPLMLFVVGWFAKLCM
jgi:hypothetical protein